MPELPAKPTEAKVHIFIRQEVVTAVRVDDDTWEVRSHNGKLITYLSHEEFIATYRPANDLADALVGGQLDVEVPQGS